MNSAINLPAVYVACGMGISLCLMMLIGRRWKLIGLESEKKAIHAMLVATLAACITDIVVFTADGQSGTLAYIAIWLGNMWEFVTNVLVGPAWFVLVVCHIEGRLGRRRKTITISIMAVSLLALLLNLFVPLVFTVDEHNVYTRGPLFWLYTAIDVFFLLDGTYKYLKARIRGGVLQFFPVWQFFFPAVLGGAAQCCFYGISTIWPCLAISITGMLYCLQSELLYRDGLTGLYNHNYMEVAEKQLMRGRVEKIGAMMIDLNDFKSINDRYGHLTGDEALRTCAVILREAVGGLGSVIRYAGDEFVVLLNTDDHDTVQQVANRIHAGLDQHNAKRNAHYQLSASIGCCVIDLSAHAMDQIMNRIDAEMYKNKQEFYLQHPELNRRAPH